jgi:NADPH:quinone reductase-like Zn-dependent oxidoreductase
MPPCEAAVVSAGTIHVREVARPLAGPGQVLVKIRYAGVNPVDWKSAGGNARMIRRQPARASALSPRSRASTAPA